MSYYLQNGGIPLAHFEYLADNGHFGIHTRYGVLDPRLKNQEGIDEVVEGCKGSTCEHAVDRYDKDLGERDGVPGEETEQAKLARKKEKKNEKSNASRDAINLKDDEAKLALYSVLPTATQSTLGDVLVRSRGLGERHRNLLYAGADHINELYRGNTQLRVEMQVRWPSPPGS